MGGIVAALGRRLVGSVLGRRSWAGTSVPDHASGLLWGAPETTASMAVTVANYSIMADGLMVVKPRVHLAVVMGVVTFSLLAGCRSHEPSPPPATTDAGPPSAVETRPPDAPGRSDRPKIVALGDSLTAGYGLSPDASYPSVLQATMDAAGYDYVVVNMGVSGDTSAGALRRLDWALEGDVRVLIVALGGNDGLRGLSPEEMEANLTAIIDGAKARGSRVLLCGMEAPPNLGPQYTAAFRQVFPRLARERDVQLLPFLLEGVAGNPSLNQSDGIHPNEAGARVVADLVWRSLEPLLDVKSPS